MQRKVRANRFHHLQIAGCVVDTVSNVVGILFVVPLAFNPKL
uniref:Uncharacterized protein n=1 Tax=Vibrio parahaemolyticus TaxID=670 RepID=A0A5P5X5K1_VIBPH|nr:hypothetical protein [Vibrio parahaemolyticus]